MSRQHEASDEVTWLEELARVRSDPGVRQLARRIAQDPELAEDALQQAFYVMARVKNREGIDNLRGYFFRVLLREIARERAELRAAVLEDFGLADAALRRLPPAAPPVSLEDHVSRGLYMEGLLRQFSHDHLALERSVPARSPDPGRYRKAIAEAAKQMLVMIVQGDDLSFADMKAVLTVEYPQWWDEPGLNRNVLDQRLSRGRNDVRDLLKQLISHETLLP